MSLKWRVTSTCAGLATGAGGVEISSTEAASAGGNDVVSGGAHDDPFLKLDPWGGCAKRVAIQKERAVDDDAWARWHTLKCKTQGLQLTKVRPRKLTWADAPVEVDTESPSVSPDVKVAALRNEHIQFHFKPSVGTWFGLSSHHEIIRRIRDSRYSSWDPITEDAVAEGAFVLADTAIVADNENESVQECARGIIISSDHSKVCRIGFLNKADDHLTFATMQLPDDRILQPLPNESDESDQSED